jgi:hypothetical protein
MFLEPAPSLSPPWSLCVIVTDHGRAPFTRCHLPRPKLVTSSSSQHRHHLWARDAVHLAPSLGPQCHRPPWARDVVVHVTSQSKRCRRPRTFLRPVTLLSSLSPQRCQPRAVPEPAMPSSSLSPQRCIVYFSLSFWGYKSWIWYVTLPHCFDMLYCFYFVALLWYATLIHYFDMLHCFDMPHCFDMLYCHIALRCCNYFCSAAFWSIWMHTTLINNESGLSETSVAMWTNIIVLLRFYHRTTCSI